MIRTISFLFLALQFSTLAGARQGAPKGYNGELAPAPAAELPAELVGIGIKEKLGQKIDFNLSFTDEYGKTVKLGDFFKDNKPVILSPVYYSCPSLCNFHLNGLIDALKEMDWIAGNQFKVVAVSFDAKETSEVALKKKNNYMKVYDKPGSDTGWSFLTGAQAEIAAITESVGFSFKWNEKENEWAHASAAIVISPDGTISRYLPGIMFATKDVKLALVEAGKGHVGTFVDQLILYCFQYNPHQSKYTLYVLNIMKLGGAAMILFLIVWMTPNWLRARRSEEARNT
jgi:protein SCO1